MTDDEVDKICKEGLKPKIVPKAEPKKVAPKKKAKKAE